MEMSSGVSSKNRRSLSEELESLHSRLDQLSDLIDTVPAKITSVLTPACDEETAGGAAPQPDAAPLILAAAGANVKVASMISRLQETLNRLEL